MRISSTKYRRVRTATFMGRFLIDRIVGHDGAGNLRWDGNLSRISVADYVDRFRDRIPTRLKGSEFLKRFGETGDPLTSVAAEVVYKIRSRTEHHVYEHSRSCIGSSKGSRASHGVGTGRSSAKSGS